MPDDPDAASSPLPSFLRAPSSSDALSAGDRPSTPEITERRFGRTRVVAKFQKHLQQFFPSRDSDEDERVPTQQDHDNNQRHQNLVDNIQDVKEFTAEDVMVPRADIVAIPVTTTHEDLMALYLERPHTRLPIYQDTLDDIIGFVHIKDVLTAMAAGKRVEIRELLRDVMIISPSLPVLNLLVEMQQSKRQLAVVVDEYGGIDGLVAMNDIIEAIVGEIRDEHIHTRTPRLIDRGDGIILADARVYIEDFEERYGEILSQEEREEIDTLGGLVMSLAGHLPVRGEILIHPSGWQFEIIDADPRRVKRMRLRAPENNSTN